jgi:predicted RNA-binding Zn-ribbon protein involved in translation (DUF1610 family)
MPSSTPNTLDRRVRRLETGTAQGPCPECGFDGDWSKVGFEVRMGKSPRPDNCTTCGRVQVVRVRGLGRVSRDS